MPTAGSWAQGSRVSYRTRSAGPRSRSPFNLPRVHGCRGCYLSSPLTLEHCLILPYARTDPDGQRIQDLAEPGPDRKGDLEHAAGTGRPVLLQTIDPYAYTDRHPWAYQVLRAVSPYRGYRAAGPVRVCIHLRWGDNCVPGRQDQDYRLLPTSYYLRACGTVLEALRRQGAPFVVRLHTEVPPGRFTLHPGMSGLYFPLHEPATVDPAEYALEDFDALPNLETVVNVEPREVLDDFATADVLLLSRSSLGYLGALLNPHGLVIYAPWWHQPLPDWLAADVHGNLDTVEVATRIADHLRRRG